MFSRGVCTTSSSSYTVALWEKNDLRPKFKFTGKNFLFLQLLLYHLLFRQLQSICRYFLKASYWFFLRPSSPCPSNLPAWSPRPFLPPWGASETKKVSICSLTPQSPRSIMPRDSKINFFFWSLSRSLCRLLSHVALLT